MENQVRIEFDRKKARARRDDGINRAVTKADAMHDNEWSTKAYDFLVGYIKINPVFQVEDVRYASQGIVPPPKSQRAWGAIILKAAKEGLIWQDGYRKVKNVLAHRTPAAVWKSKIVNQK